jgi:hypothetical protein
MPMVRATGRESTGAPGTSRINADVLPCPPARQRGPPYAGAVGHAPRQPVTATPDLRDDTLGAAPHGDAAVPPASRPPTVPARVRARILAVDPLAVLCGLVALVVYTLRGFDGPLSRDLAVYAYGGQSVADGDAPYVAIFNRAGPLAHLVPGIGAAAGRVVGVDDVRGMRVLFMLLAVGAVVAVYLVGRDLFAGRAAGLAAAAALLSFEGFTVYATNGPREKTTMVLLLTLAVLALVHRRWGTCGAMIALGTLTWQPVFLPAMAAAVVAALLGRDRVSALVRLAVGGAVPTAITVLGYLAIGRLQLFLDAFLLVNLRYTDQGSMLDRPAVLWASLSGAYGWSVWVIGLGLATLVALGVAAVASRRRRSPRNAALAGLGLAVLVCLAWSAAAFNGWPDAYVALPFAAVGVAGLVPLLAVRLPGRVVTGVVVAWALAATSLAAVFCVSTRADVLDDQRTEALAVMSHLPADAEILSISAPSVLVLVHKHNPSRFQLFGQGLNRYIGDTWPGGMTGYGRWIDRRAPELVLFGQVRTPRWIRGMLDTSYVHVGHSRGKIRWYVRVSVPHDQREAIRTALRGR